MHEGVGCSGEDVSPVLGLARRTGLRHPAIAPHHIPHQRLLYIAAPKELFGRTDDEEQQQRQQPRGIACLHAVDEIDLRTRKVEHPLRQLIPHPEHTPQQRSDASTQDCREAPVTYTHARPAQTTEEPRKRCEDERRSGHRIPEIEIRCCPRREHQEPQHGGNKEGREDTGHGGGRGYG